MTVNFQIGTDSGEMMVRGEWTSELDSTFTISGSQVSKVALKTKFILGKASPQDKITLWVSLENSTINPGALVHDKKAHKGYFQDHIDLDISVCREDSSGDLVLPISEMDLLTNAPHNANLGGSVSGSVSFNVSASASVGFFGDTPTGDVGIGIGMAQSHGESVEIHDFLTVNNSGRASTPDGVVRQSFSMGQTGVSDLGSSHGSAAYTKPRDLIHNWGNDLLVERLDPPRVYTPPVMATNDFNFYTQAVWQAVDDKMIAEDAFMYFKITQRCVDVKAKREGIDRHLVPTVDKQFVTYEFWEPIPFALLNSSVGTTV